MATEAASDGPAIRALGSLFTVSQVFLWDDSKVSYEEFSGRSTNLEEGEEQEECMMSTIINANESTKLSEADCNLEEDLELAHHMAALGLPASFSTTKQRLGATSRKRKGMLVKSNFPNKDIDDLESGVSRIEEKNCCLSGALHVSTDVPVPVKSTEGDYMASHVEALEESTNESVLVDAVFSYKTTVTISKVPESEACDETTTLDGVVDEIQNNGLGVQGAKAYDETTTLEGVVDDIQNNDVEVQGANLYPNENKSGSNFSPDIMEDLSSQYYLENSNKQDSDDTYICWESGDWTVLWDDFYSRNYFYNSKTQETTWYAPPGLENLACSFSVHTSNGLSADAVEQHSDEVDAVVHSDEPDEKITCPEVLNVPDVSQGVFETSCSNTSSNGVGYGGAGTEGLVMDELNNNHNVAIVKSKRRANRHRSSHQSQGLCGDISMNVFKYWCQRYLLFSRYDSGIKMDEEGWFSVTPEAIARHHATRCGGGVVIDCFAGVGGNAIQFAIKSDHVVAIDIDPQKIQFAYHNSTVYGVNDKIDFIQGDFFEMASHLKGDIVFLSPPWGGPGYAYTQTYDIRSMLKPCDGYFLFETARMVASKVVIFLPRNVDLNQLAELCLSVDPPWTVEVEKNILNGKLKAVTAYFSSTA